jgi:TPR repeat protein
MKNRVLCIVMILSLIILNLNDSYANELNKKVYSISEIEALGYDRFFSLIEDDMVGNDFRPGEVQFLLGFMKYFSIGTDIDNKRAVILFQESSDLGYDLGKLYLGRAYYHGSGILKNKDWGLKLVGDVKETVLNCKDGNSICEFTMGWMYENGVCVDKDTLEAFKHYKRSKKAGLMFSNFRLGQMYRYGIGVNKDKKKAKELFSEIARLDNPRGFQKLGYDYYINEDNEDALKWLKKAANKNDPYSMYLLSKMYKNGWGIEKNFDTVKKYYSKIKDSTYRGMSLIEQPVFAISSTDPNGHNHGNLKVLQWKSTDKDNMNKSHSSGLYIDSWMGEEYQSRMYLLDGQYDFIAGLLVTSSKSQNATDNWQKANVEFYGDGDLLYNSNIIRGGVRPQEFLINVSSVDEFEIRIYDHGVDFGIVDTYFYYY